MKKFFIYFKNLILILLTPSFLVAGNSTPIPSAMLERARAKMVEVKKENERLEQNGIEDSINNSAEEVLDEVDAPAPPPSLIDLDANAKPKSSDLTSAQQAALIFFNAIMFTAGMATVKSIDGKKVHQ